MNLLLHGIGGESEEDLPVVTKDALAGKHGEYEIVLANPPFGKKSSVTIVNEAGESSKESLIINRDDFWASTSNKQLNFLQHIFTILKQHGRAAVVLPDNVLFEGGAGETIRRELLKQADVHTLLRLPTGIFYAQGVKANVLFFDRKPAQEKPWTQKLWIYDLRTNLHFTLKENTLKRSDLDDFVACYNPKNRHERKESERFKSFTYEELTKRDKVNLDIFWLKDDALEESANLPAPDMGRIYNNIVETVGRTPLVKLNKVTAGVPATILLKCEFFNPLGSVKDRIGMSMIEDAEKRGILKKDTVIIEPTSGNTGIALAFVAAAKGYKLILTMPETMSLERRTLLAMLGAKLVLTPGTEGMKGAIARAEQLAKETPNSWIPQQFENPANPEIHRKTTAEEIWDDTDGKVDILVAAGRHRRHDHRLLRSHQAAQAVVPGHRRRAERFAGHFADARRPAGQTRPAQDSRHRRGLRSEESASEGSRGNPQIVECVQVSNDDSFAMARRLAKEEGILVGHFHRRECRGRPSKWPNVRRTKAR